MDPIFQMSEVKCNHAEHNEQQITSLCLSPKCSQKRVCCHQCAVKLHPHCAPHIIFLDKVSKMADIIRKNGKVFQERVEQCSQMIIKKMSEIQESLFKPIEQCQQCPNLNALENLAQVLSLHNHQKCSVIKEIEKAEQEICANLKTFKFYIQSLVEMPQDIEHIHQIPDLNVEAESLQFQSMVTFNKNAKIALDCIDKAIKLIPNNREFWSQKGRILKEFCRYEEAVKSFEQSIAIRPTIEAYHCQALSLFMLKRPQEATRCIEQGLKIFPNNPNLLQIQESHKAKVH